MGSRPSRTGEGVVSFLQIGALSQWSRRLGRFGRLATIAVLVLWEGLCPWAVRAPVRRLAGGRAAPQHPAERFIAEEEAIEESCSEGPSPVADRASRVAADQPRSARHAQQRCEGTAAGIPECGHGVVEHLAVLVTGRPQDPREGHARGGHAADVCQF